MADYTRRSFPGGAAATTLTSGCGTTDTTLSIAVSTGWPDGTAGPYFCVVDQGQVQEEKILVTARSGTTLTCTRGADGTVAAAHASGAAIFPCFTATDADSANAHYNDVADNHAQYLNTARHDVQARHTFGNAFATPGTPPTTGTSGSAGSAAGPARSDHSHGIGAGSVVAGSFAAGAIATNDLANGAVTSAKIASGTVTGGNIASQTITDSNVSTSAAIAHSKIAAGGAGAGSFGNAFAWPILTVDAAGMITGQSTQTAPTYFAYQTSATPADFTQSGLGSYNVVTGSTVTITNPGKKVNVSANAIGNTDANVSGVVGDNLRISISIDGGTTWTAGPAPQVAYGTGTIAQIPFNVAFTQDGVTPSGNIQARLEMNSSLGSAGNHVIRHLFIQLQAWPA